MVPVRPSSTSFRSDSGAAKRSPRPSLRTSSTFSYTSSPAMSEIWNGPKKGRRNPKQLRTTSSTSCGEANPSSTHLTASKKRAFWMRLATNPGPSPTTAGRFPIPRRNSTSRSTTSGAVVAAGMTSTPGVHSGGLNQCIPQKRPGLPTNSERSLIGNEDVLETITASCGAASEQESRISSFNPMSSGTASKTRPTSPTAPATSSAVSTASTLSTASSANSPASACPLARCTSRLFASLVSSGVASVRSTLIPAAAKHSATPNPIVPAPIMAAPRGQSWWDPRSSIRYQFSIDSRMMFARSSSLTSRGVPTSRRCCFIAPSTRSSMSSSP